MDGLTFSCSSFLLEQVKDQIWKHNCNVIVFYKKPFKKFKWINTFINIALIFYEYCDV